MSHVQGRRVDGCHQHMRNKAEALQPLYICCVHCSTHLAESLITYGWSSLPVPQRRFSHGVATCSLLRIISVMRFCFAAHDLWVLRFITLLWENLPLPLQRKMVTSRGKISHLTFFKLKMKYFRHINEVFKKWSKHPYTHHQFKK